MTPARRGAYTAQAMHPIMVTVPGVVFKFIAPALILWGLYSLIVAYNRRAMAARARDEAEKKAKDKAIAAKPKARRKDADTAARASDGPEQRPEGSKPATAERLLPSDSPTNALISLAIGIGLFVFAAPVRVQGQGAERLFSALSAFARGVIDRGVWSARWESLPIYSYGVMLGTSLVVGWYLTLGLSQRDGLPRERMADCYVFTAFSAIVGARLLYVLTNLHEFSDPRTHEFMFSQIFALRSGGLVAYGGFLGGLVGSIVFLRRNGFSLWKWADAAVPSLATGLMITRLGCYMYGCDFGKPLSNGAPRFLRALGTFPHWADDKGSPAWQQHTILGFRVDYDRCLDQFHGEWRNGLCHLDHAARYSAPVHPTQLYESLTGLTLFIVLMWLWRRRKFEGQIFLAFGVLYGFARSALEIIRDDHERGFFFGLSTSQIIGLSTGLAAIVVYLWRQRTAPPAKGVDLFAPVPAVASAKKD